MPPNTPTVILRRRENIDTLTCDTYSAILPTKLFAKHARKHFSKKVRG